MLLYTPNYIKFIGYYTICIFSYKNLQNIAKWFLNYFFHAILKYMNVLVVGSSLIDFFIRIENNDQIEISDNRVSFPLGAKLPIDIKSLSLGGNSTNVASALTNLSISTSLYTYLGNDPLSKHIKEKMNEKNIELLTNEIDTTTGSLSLIFDFPTDRIIFSHHNVADYDFDESKVNKKPDIIFLTSIGKRWENAYEKVLDYAQKNNIPIAFSPGSQQLRNMNEVFIKTVKASKYLLCNLDEARKITEVLSGNKIDDTKELLTELKSFGFDTLSITDGSNGAYAVDINNTIYKVNSVKPEGFEKTGAGDAYAGAFLAAILLEKGVMEAMRWGVLNAMGEMKHVGAQTGQLKLDEIEKQSHENKDLVVEKI